MTILPLLPWPPPYLLFINMSNSRILALGVAGHRTQDQGLSLEGREEENVPGTGRKKRPLQLLNVCP